MASASSPFIAAMDAAQTPSLIEKTLGENAAPEYTASGVNDPRVALFFALVRDIPAERLKTLLRDVLNIGTTKSRYSDGTNEAIGQTIADGFVMAFQTRNCRGGKGERTLFHRMILELSVLFPDTVAALMPLVPHYGSCRDWFKIIAMARDEKETSHEVRAAMVPVVDIIFDLARDQLQKDRALLEGAKDANKSSKELSLLAKWCPREKRVFSSQVGELAKRLFPSSPAPKKEYRKLVSTLNRHLETVEVKMTSNRWDKINFGKNVPSLALRKYRKAFLNEKVNGPPPQDVEEETGNRFPDNEVRVACRKRLRDEMLKEGKSKLKGRQLFPHEIAKSFMGHSGMKNLSTLEKDLLSIQWQDIRKSVIEAIGKVRDAREAADSSSSPTKVLDLGKLVPLIDVSGSMYGTPMEVAISLGILISELAAPAFADRCLTFSAEPEWVLLSPEMTLEEKVRRVSKAPWGMNTNFEAATEKILDAAAKAKLNPDDIPDLIVFSDMQFDEARGQRYGDNAGHEWETHYERIVRRFEETGIKVSGEPWPAPQIIFWNLRGDTGGFPAQANAPGVTMLSGYSPALMKMLLNGEDQEEILTEDEVEDEDGVVRIVKKQKKKDPYATVRKLLDAGEYDPIRSVLSKSGEGALAQYRWSPSEQEEAAGTVGTNIKSSTTEGDWVVT